METLNIKTQLLTISAKYKRNILLQYTKKIELLYENYAIP